MVFSKKSNTAEDQSVHKSHLKNLMVLAGSDGHIAQIEEHLLLAIAHRLGLNEEDVEVIKTDLDNISFVLPEKYDDRIEQFNDLLSLMAVDGKIDPSEEQLCYEFAERYELMDSVVDEMVQRYK
ncbi:MAG: hypothetical protein R3345_09775 [Fulvivirga sp.]|nr:hypothetical protein [Fulvivirga sp.]